MRKLYIGAGLSSDAVKDCRVDGQLCAIGEGFIIGLQVTEKVLVLDHFTHDAKSIVP